MVVVDPWPETDWDALVLALVLAVGPADADELAGLVETAENLAATMSASQVEDAQRAAERALSPPWDSWCCASHRDEALAAIGSSSSALSAFVIRQRRMRMVLAHGPRYPWGPVPYDVAIDGPTRPWPPSPSPV